MSITTAILLAGFVLFFTFCSTKYDIHMFQLSSYRYSRYFRWLLPGNILQGTRLCAIVLMMANIPVNATYRIALLLAVYATFSIVGRKNKVQKTPLVYTARVKRLYSTAVTVYAAAVAATALLAPAYAIATATTLLLLSDIVMLAANLINTPIEKGINRHYYNDAKRIIDGHKGLIVIGVTGSFGKTSTKNYLASILAEKYNILVTPGNFNTLLGVIRTIREQLRPYHQVFIVEMGAKQKNDIKEICDLVHPTIGIVTAVGEMHLETFKCIGNIQDTKFELINSLPAGGTGIINIDSPHIKSYKKITSPCKIITYGIENSACYRAGNIEYGASGVNYTLVAPQHNGDEYNSRLLGEGNLLNILGATAVADLLQVPVAKQKKAIAHLQPVEHRLSMRKSGGVTVLDDAYNSNPQGAKMALGVLKNFAVSEGNKRIIITPGFVEMGTRQAEANSVLGEQIARCADYAIVVNATNREAIKSGLEKGNMPTERYFLADSLNHAHTHLATILRAGDVVLYENDLPDNFK
ncbi:MAG: UDP-N-acetylmuramoyl-tripeptide--D-alanyl-D-alanine ligase [Bacteroidaceae bacterium]|nr:UDP-N-acetylmuramoyl-tripeptide--D-alanyl-D-alanine ligase [Bacteroidaceae bacterium]